jgi:hypothetical protein
LDNLVNNDSSWAYNNDQQAVLFRSVDNAGITPSFGIDTKVDADSLFRQSLK